MAHQLNDLSQSVKKMIMAHQSATAQPTTTNQQQHTTEQKKNTGLNYKLTLFKVQILQFKLLNYCRKQNLCHI